MSWLKKLAPKTIHYATWEMVLIRLLFAAAVFDTIPWTLHPTWAAMPNPNGLAKLVPLGWIAHPGVMDTLKPVVIGGLLLYVSGFAMILGLLPALFAILGAGAVWASQREGAAQHSVQLVAMIVMGQFAVLAWRAWEHRSSLKKVDDYTANMVVHISKWVVATTYVACAFMKLKANGIFWFQKGPAMAVQTIKTNLQGHYSEPDIALNTFIVEQVPRWFADHPVFSGLFFGIGLLLELFAFLFLAGRRWALAVGGGLLIMHLMIYWLTTIKFMSHLWAVSIFCVLPGLWGFCKKDQPLIKW